MSYVKIIEDSIAPNGVRLTSVELRVWRPMTSQVNTHRDWSRNSSSSRARPLRKRNVDPEYLEESILGTLDEAEYSPFMPLEYVSEKPGMTGGSPLKGYDLEQAKALINDMRESAIRKIGEYVDNAKVRYGDDYRKHILHKGLINRYLEPWLEQKIIVTATRWDNFFSQRIHKDAQAEIAIPARDLKDALDRSTPRRVDYGEWHTPFITDEDRDSLSLDDRIKVSIARCARVSYLNHNGERDIDKDLRLFDALDSQNPPHLSPMEHVATPLKSTMWFKVFGKAKQPVCANLDGWKQYRHMRHL